MSAEEDQIRDALDAAERSIGGAVTEAFDWLAERNTEAEIASRMAGHVDEIVADIDRAGEMIAQAVNDAFAARMRAISDAIGSAIDTKFHADPQNPLAVQAMRDNRLRIVREVVDEQRTVIREVLIDAVQRGTNPLEAARTIRQSIGLTQHQLRYVDSYRSALERNSLDALARQLRDRRFDPTVRRAASGERLLTREQIDRMVERYRERWIKFRADTIARTEALRSVHQGANEAYRQAIERGDLSAETLEGTWYHHDPQSHPRPHHQEMHGQVQPWGTPFVSGLGNELMHPGDPDAPASETVNCHCGVGYRIQTARQRAAA